MYGLYEARTLQALFHCFSVQCRNLGDISMEHLHGTYPWKHISGNISMEIDPWMFMLNKQVVPQWISDHTANIYK